MVDPQIYLGDPLTGYGADASRVAFRKYNEHNHPQVLSSFLYEPIDIGDELALYVEGTNVLAYEGAQNSPTVLNVTSEYLEASTQATQSGVGTLHINGLTYANIIATQGSNQLTVDSAAAGFISPQAHELALTQTYQGTVAVDTTNPLTLDPQEVTDLMAVLGQPPLSLPVQAIPILLSSPKLRLKSLHLLPQWTTNSTTRTFTARLALNGEAFEYATNAFTVGDVGRYSLALNHKLVQADTAIYLQLFNPQNLARLTYQLTAIAVG